VDGCAVLVSSQRGNDCAAGWRRLNAWTDKPSTPRPDKPSTNGGGYGPYVRSPLEQTLQIRHDPGNLCGRVARFE